MIQSHYSAKRWTTTGVPNCKKTLFELKKMIACNENSSRW